MTRRNSLAQSWGKTVQKSRNYITTSTKSMTTRVNIGYNTHMHTHMHTRRYCILDRVVHCLADVQHGVKDDRVSGWFHLMSAGNKQCNADISVLIIPFRSKLNLGFNVLQRTEEGVDGVGYWRQESWRSSVLKSLTLIVSHLMKTSMIDLQTSTLTLSFWNMSRNGRKRSCETKTSVHIR